MSFEELIREHRQRMREITEKDRQRTSDLGQLNMLGCYLAALGKDPEKKLHPKTLELMQRGLAGESITGKLGDQAEGNK